LKELRQQNPREAAPRGNGERAPSPSAAAAAMAPAPSAGDTAVIGSTAMAGLPRTALTKPAAPVPVTLVTPPETRVMESTQKITLPLSPALQAIATPLKA